jgi:ketosteroid isomerase-like protein
MPSTEVQALTERLHRVEAQQQIRNTLGRYMHLCDQPCADSNFPRLADLFTEDAVWEGIGALYAGKFGRHQGRAAIAAFVGAYLAPSRHFKRNHHFLTSDQVCIEKDGGVQGQWLMLQLSTYDDETAQAITARLTIDFAPLPDGRWAIAHFRTERLECVPWNREAAGEEPA